MSYGQNGQSPEIIQNIPDILWSSVGDEQNPKYLTVRNSIYSGEGHYDETHKVKVDDPTQMFMNLQLVKDLGDSFGGKMVVQTEWIQLAAEHYMLFDNMLGIDFYVYAQGRSHSTYES